MKSISTWLVRLSMAFLWVFALALWTGIFTILMLGIAENYNIKVVPEIAKYQYEK